MTNQYQPNSINVPKQARTATAAALATLDDSIIVANSAGGAFAVTLPNAAQIPGNVLMIKAPVANVNNVTVNTVLGQTIDGAATFVMNAAQQSLVVQSDGANWSIALPAGPGIDTTAIHVNVAGEIAGIALKAAPVSADLLVIEDSADANNKKRITVGTIPVAQSQVQSTVVQVASDAASAILDTTGGIQLAGTTAGAKTIATTSSYPGQKVHILLLGATGGSYGLTLDVGTLTAPSPATAPSFNAILAILPGFALAFLARRSFSLTLQKIMARSYLRPGHYLC